VKINELVPPGRSPSAAPLIVRDAADNARDGAVTINELVRGVNRASQLPDRPDGQVLLSARASASTSTICDRRGPKLRR
jgi:hypothetical protein